MGVRGSVNGRKRSEEKRKKEKRKKEKRREEKGKRGEKQGENIRLVICEGTN